MERLKGEPPYDVPDSTDWLNTPLSGLMPVEQAFRCHVCKDFYNSPMLTSCNHTFCSLCIRRCLAVDGKCPLCRKTDQESRLRGNWALREAVDSFKACRAVILEFARKPPPSATVASPKRKATEVEESEYEEDHRPKRTRRSTRSTRTRGAEAAAAMSQEEMYSPERDGPADEYLPGTETSAKVGVYYVLTSSDDGLVACPICWQRMKLEAVDRHISTGSCPGSPQPQTQSQGPISNPPSTRDHQSAFFPSSKTNPQQPARAPEHLPALNYSMLKDNVLRKKLADLNISTYGTRQMLEQRHKEWVTIWNANCDSAHPKSRSELLRDLDSWERTVSSAARSSGLYGGHATQPQVKDKDFDGASWATNHDTSFKDLIAKARQTKKQAEQKARDSGVSEPAPPPSLDSTLEPTQEPTYAAQQTIGGDVQPGVSNSVSMPLRSQDQTSGFERPADYTIPGTNDGAVRPE